MDCELHLEDGPQCPQRILEVFDAAVPGDWILEGEVSAVLIRVEPLQYTNLTCCRQIGQALPDRAEKRGVGEGGDLPPAPNGNNHWRYWG